MIPVYTLNNDYSGFPDDAADGDTYVFNDRTYVFKNSLRNWVDASIPNDADLINSLLYIGEILKPLGKFTDIHIISKREDIEADKFRPRG